MQSSEQFLVVYGRNNFSPADTTMLEVKTNKKTELDVNRQINLENAVGFVRFCFCCCCIILYQCQWILYSVEYIGT